MSFDNRVEQGFLNCPEVAAKLGISSGAFDGMRHRGLIPQPSHRVEGLRRRYYAPEDVETIRAIIQQHRPTVRQIDPPGYVSRITIQQRVGISPTTCHHHYKKGHFAPATHKIMGYGGRCFYTHEEAQVIIDFFTKDRVPPGYMWVTEMARRCQVSHHTLRGLGKAGALPLATTKIAGRLNKTFYTDDEARIVMGYFLDRSRIM